MSVIVPCWNAAATLGETLDSIAGQTHRDWETIIVDDGSTDRSAEIAQRYASHDSRFVVVAQQNAGLSAARNRGLQRARGEFILLLDADDLIGPEKLAEQTLLSSARPREIVYSDCTYFSGHPPYRFTRAKDGSDRPSLAGHTGGPEAMLRVLAQGNIMPVSAPLLPRTAFDEIGAFDTQLTALEDWDLWIRCARAGYGFFHDPSPKIHTMIRLRPGSMSTDASRMLRNEIAIRWKHRSVPAMRDVFRAKRRFHAKAACADALKLEWVRAFDHARFVHPRFWITS